MDKLTRAGIVGRLDQTAEDLKTAARWCEFVRDALPYEDEELKKRAPVHPELVMDQFGTALSFARRAFARLERLAPVVEERVDELLSGSRWPARHRSLARKGEGGQS